MSYIAKRITEAVVGAPVDADVFVFDGTGGVKKITYANLLAAIVGLVPFAITSVERLREIVSAEGYQLTAITYDSDGVVTTATVLWPDGSAGTFTTVTKNATFLSIDAFTITHTTSGKTITQTAVTRNANGQVTVKPALTITP